MSEQLNETSISQGHSTFGICDGICIFMCECEESDFEINSESASAMCFQVVGSLALDQR